MPNGVLYESAVLQQKPRGSPNLLIDTYPRDIQEIIKDYLVGGRAEHKANYNKVLDDLKHLITVIDMREYMLFVQNFVPLDRDPNASYHDRMLYRLLCQYFKEDCCSRPATVKQIFTRIWDWRGIFTVGKFY